MNIRNQLSQIRKTLYGIMLLAVFFSAFGKGSLSSADAQEAAVLTTDYILSDGQFVYGPNVGDFKLRTYLKDNAPHLLKYADDLYGRSEYFSINPKVYLTLLEVHAHLISKPDLIKAENPFDLPDMNFISQIDLISNAMVNTYYLRLYSYTSLPASQRTLSPLANPNGGLVHIASDANAGTYAVIAALAEIKSEKDIFPILDNSRSDGFYQTYIKLFGSDNPLDEKNHIYIPGEVDAIPAPDNFLQLPYLHGLSWRFGGVHDSNGGGGNGSPFNDASSMDFYPSGSAWGIDTSNMWVVAAASGTPTRLSACGFKIVHSDGWETTYYHLENTQYLSGSINQNDKIGVIANTLAEATCTGGAASGPHVHFSLRRNGALVAINGTPLSGWVVHAGRWNYDTDHNYMWLERAGLKKYPFSDVVVSEGTLPTVVSSVRANADPSGAANVNFTVTFSQSVTGVNTGDFSLTTSGVSGAAVSGVSGSGSIYAVTVNTGSGSGTIQLNVVDNDSILNGSSIPLNGAGAGNGNFISGQTYTITKTWIFGDVPNTYWANIFIERLYNAGITGGCSEIPLNYCPTNSVTRAQMAIFLLRGMHGSAYTPPVATGTKFNDVPPGTFGAAWIEQLATEGITSGCGGGNYCPTQTVSRAQMAIFLVRAKHGSTFIPPTATGIFADVPIGSFGANYIEQLVTDAITSGCGSGNFCPNTLVKRDSMAVFLVKTFNLP